MILGAADDQEQEGNPRLEANFLTWVSLCHRALVTTVDNFVESSLTFVDVITLYIVQIFESVSTFVHLGFTDFQLTLLQVFLVILVTHAIAISFAWRIYKDRISERFLKTGISAAELKEQLKSGVSDLKLPLEHTPRW